MRLAPDLRDRFAQQAPSSLAQTDPTSLLPPVNTPPPSVVPNPQPGGGFVLLAPPGTPAAPLVAQAEQATAAAAPSTGGSRYKSVNEIPKVRPEDFQAKPKTDWSDPRMLVNNLGVATGVRRGALKREQFLKARLDQWSNIAMMAGVPEAERRAQRDAIRYAMSGQIPVGENQVKDAKDLSDDEWATILEQQVAAAEEPLIPEAIARTAGGGGVPGLGATAQLPTPGTWSPEQLMQMQASAQALMKPYADRLEQMGMSDVAAAYMQQAYNSPLVAQAQAAERYAAEVQSLQNQLLAQRSGGGDQLTPEMLEALTAAGP